MPVIFDNDRPGELLSAFCDLCGESMLDTGMEGDGARWYHHHCSTRAYLIDILKERVWMLLYGGVRFDVPDPFA